MVNVHESDNDDPPYEPRQPLAQVLPSSPHTPPRPTISNIEVVSRTPPKNVLPEYHQMLATLEYAWGMKLGTLNLDTTQNMIWLSPNLHIYFDTGDWALVPPLSDLEAIQRITFAEVSYTQKTKKFTQVCPRANRVYDFAHFQPSTEPLFRFEPSSLAPYTCHTPPYTTLPPINSHVNPYFVICNVAVKDRQHRPNIGLPGVEDGYTTLQADILARVRLCRTIYDVWMGQKEAARAALNIRFNHPAPSSHPSAHTSTSRRSTPPRGAKRTRPDDPEDNELNPDERGSPTGRGRASGSALGDSIRTPQDDVGEDFGFQDDWWDVMDQSCAKVQDWFMHLDPSPRHRI